MEYTLVFVHGAGNNKKVWEPLLEHIEGKTLPLELPGHGDTPGDGADSIEEYARWVKDRVEDAGPEAAVLVGHSMGGAIVQKLLADNPSWLKGAVLVSTGAKLKVNPAIIEGLQKDPASMCKKIAGWAVAKGAPEETREFVESIFCSARPDVVVKDFAACDRFSGEEYCKKAQVPVLIAVGSEDVMTPLKLSQKLKELIPSSTLKVIDGAGHMLQVERPAELAELIVDFVSRL